MKMSSHCITTALEFLCQLTGVTPGNLFKQLQKVLVIHCNWPMADQRVAFRSSQRRRFWTLEPNFCRVVWDSWRAHRVTFSSYRVACVVVQREIAKQEQSNLHRVKAIFFSHRCTGQSNIYHWPTFVHILDGKFLEKFQRIVKVAGNFSANIHPSGFSELGPSLPEKDKRLTVPSRPATAVIA